ncbi:MAG: AI-2E family transporter, partial [Sphaerochaetaceae bacterium]|nr:AI-2E family transporter [Sphaerochaetaceae bacterium]
MVDKKERDIKVVKYILIVFLVIAGLAVSKMTGVVSTRILLTLFIFLLVLPLVSALEHAKFPSWLATLIAVLVIVTVILFFVWFIFFTVDKLISMLPAYASRINDLDGVLKSLFSRWIDFPDDVSFLSSLNIDWVGSIIMPALKSVSSSAISIVSNVLLVLLMTVFLLMERNTIIPKLENFIVNKD